MNQTYENTAQSHNYNVWQNGKHSIGGMGLRPLEDLATSQVGLVPPLNSLICICYHTDLYLLPHSFIFVTTLICISHNTDLYFLHHRFSSCLSIETMTVLWDQWKQPINCPLKQYNIFAKTPSSEHLKTWQWALKVWQYIGNGRFVAGTFHQKLANSLKQRSWLWEWTFWQ